MPFSFTPPQKKKKLYTKIGIFVEELVFCKIIFSLIGATDKILEISMMVCAVLFAVLLNSISILG